MDVLLEWEQVSRLSRCGFNREFKLLEKSTYQFAVRFICKVACFSVFTLSVIVNHLLQYRHHRLAVILHQEMFIHNVNVVNVGDRGK